MIEKRLILHGHNRNSILEEEGQYKLNSSIKKNNYSRKCCSRRCIRGKRRGNNFFNGELKTVNKDSTQSCISSCLSSLGENAMNLEGEGVKKRYRKRTRKLKRKALVLDEVARLLRRTRYLLVRVKLEQNLIDAYSAEGWKGKSREKIRPESELQRARKKILNCKAGIRDAIHQIELQSREGCIEDSVMHPDGSVHHEHIFCAKCKSREAFSDNDIILCDGACNRAFHQKCLEPPLEKIPPGDQGWLCSFCECKMEILESVNAHLGTSFNIDSRWEEIFKEVAASHDDGNSYLDPAHEWPSEDSDDDDYNPEENEKNSIMIANDGNIPNDDDDGDDCDDDGFSSSDSFYYADEANLEFQGPVNDDDHDVSCFRRQRRDVDYKKLYAEMFGKDRHESEESDEDEDWGPRSRGQRQKKGMESDNNILGSCDIDYQELEKEGKKCLFRIPREAVEKLRQVFGENELPSKTLREDLSRDLGLSTDKVSQWFKNARYAALRIKKANLSAVREENMKANLSAVFNKNTKANLSAVSKDYIKANTTVVPNENAKGNLSVAHDYQTVKYPTHTEEASAEKSPLLDQVERLCSLSDKISRLKAALKDCCEPDLDWPTVMYIPVAELREKLTGK